MKRSKDKLDRELILRSIFEKWNPICLGCHQDGGNEDCPLCQEYFEDNNGSPICPKCPILLRTGCLICKGTPYEMYNKVFPPKEFDAAEEEIEFLISLLDKETQENLEEIFTKWCKKGIL